MVQVHIEVEELQAKFLQQYRLYGFSNQDALVRAAIERLRQELESEQLDLDESAQLYAEVYETCGETQALTQAALNDWPE